jgi:hypothetical protein
MIFPLTLPIIWSEVIIFHWLSHKSHAPETIPQQGQYIDSFRNPKWKGRPFSDRQGPRWSESAIRPPGRRNLSAPSPPSQPVFTYSVPTDDPYAPTAPIVLEGRTGLSRNS